MKIQECSLCACDTGRRGEDNYFLDGLPVCQDCHDAALEIAAQRKDFWKGDMCVQERASYLRDPRPDNDLDGDMLLEQQHNDRVRAWEQERYGI